MFQISLKKKKKRAVARKARAQFKFLSLTEATVSTYTYPRGHSLTLLWKSPPISHGVIQETLARGQKKPLCLDKLRHALSVMTARNKQRQFFCF